MHAAFLRYLVQAWAAGPHRPGRARGRPHGHTGRGYRARALPAVVVRRVLTVPGGGSP